MRVSLISATVVIVFCSSSLAVAESDNWDSLLQFCAKKALAVGAHPKCKWMAEECYKNNEKYAANISKFMCTNAFTMRKLGEFCCNNNLDEVREIVRAATGSSRRRRSKAHQKRSSSSSSNEFDQWISSYLS